MSLNQDSLVNPIYHGRDLILEIEHMDSETKALGDELSLEKGGYVPDPAFKTNYENALNSVLSVLAGEKSRLEALGEALHTG